MDARQKGAILPTRSFAGAVATGRVSHEVISKFTAMAHI